MHPLFVSAALLLAAALVLVGVALRALMSRRVLVQRIDSGARRASALGGFGARTLGRWRWQIDPEVSQLLDQLGWRRPSRRAVFFAIQIGIPLLTLLVVGAPLLTGDASVEVSLTALFVAGLAYLVPKRLLVSAVKRRKEHIGVEVSALIPLLRMLFEVGMTVEQALRVLSDEAARILPELEAELRLVLARVDAGLELGQELRYQAELLGVPELTDCVAILEQLVRQGGGAMASLQALKSLLDDRRGTNLQENVSKLSAKMSAVMVAFLFPALLIILAGPGFLAIFRALGAVGG